MKLIRVGAAVLNQTPLDWDGNVRGMETAIARARDEGVSLLCLPELCITGYGCEDAFYSPGVQQMAISVLHELLPKTQGLAVAFGLPLRYRKALFNAVALVVDGAIAGFVGKRYLAGDGLYYEPRWFKAWPEGQRVDVEIEGESYPFGDLIFVVDGVSVGFEICEDAWVASRPGSSLAARGVDIILNPSASHFAFGKHAVRKRFVQEGSRAFGVSYVYANLLGVSSGRMIFDGGALIASGGTLLTEGPRFSFADVHLTTAVVDVDADRKMQVSVGSFQPRLGSHPGGEISVAGFVFPEPALSVERLSPAPWEGGPREKEEEFTRALALALFDYLRKSSSRGFVVSLSGGADSAAVAVLVSLMVRFGVAELGPEGLCAKLAYLDLEGCDDEAALIRRLLLCAYQATRNSGPVTRDAAATLAAALGAEYLELDVDPQVVQYREMVEAAIGRPLSWETDDIALQNIQARVRAPGIWMLANLRGALLLATSNRSEAAVGYATMDGDTAGGLSPIAGIDKAFLRRWLSWMEQDGPLGIGPLPELAKVNRQQPTAELRPPGEGQTDEGDLMPYELLDAIERLAIRDKKVPVEVYRSMRARHPEVERRQLARWIERFFSLWCRNQWKRERYAPSFHVDDENLDPKTWCRFPILSGGFERELRDLRAFVAREAG